MKLDNYTQELIKDNIKLDEAQEDILVSLVNFNQRIEQFYKKTIFGSKTSPNGAYLHGSVGTGKTMLMDLFYEQLKINKKHKIHYHAFITEIHEYLHKLKNSPKLKKKTDLLKLAAEYIAKQYQVIYLDELQINDIADAMVVGQLFQELLKQNIIILVTSNFAPEDLYQDGLQRESFLPFINLIKDKFEVLKLKSKYDYRRNKIKSLETTYYIYNEPMDSQKFILESFLKLTNNSVPENKLITINSRELICPITAQDCSVFSFDQLCRGPMSASDYREVCQEFNIIIISEIPELSSDEHNEARRFINLIDTIYEYKKTLICSARTDIESIYKSGKWHFEFLRTMSRLHEMQSKEYIEKIIK